MLHVWEGPNQTSSDSEEGDIKTINCFNIQLCLTLQKPGKIKFTKLCLCDQANCSGGYSDTHYSSVWFQTVPTQELLLNYL